MITISLCMIVKNEEATLKRCLTAISDVVDEIIIIDTGSTDQTKKIASQFTDKVIDFVWIDDFSTARNFAFSQATKEYILWLDADDLVTPKNKALLLQLKRELDSNVDSVMMHYHILFDDKDRPTYSVQRNRLVKRKAGFKWVGFVHEFLDVYGNIMISDISIHHKKIKAHTDRNLMIFRKHIQKGTKFSPRELFYYGNELFDHSFFVEALKVYKQFLQKEDSWIEDQIAACIKMANCYAALYDTEMQIQSLLWSLRYDKPRAEICCRLGITFLNLNDVEKAIFWYELALTLGPPPAIRGLIYDEAAWSWLPHLQLCVCYDQKGDFKKALYHNDQALKYRPDHPSIIHNLKYLTEKISKNPVTDISTQQLNNS